jgi:hypothetical protein
MALFPPSPAKAGCGRARPKNGTFLYWTRHGARIDPWMGAGKKKSKRMIFFLDIEWFNHYALI